MKKENGFAVAIALISAVAALVAAGVAVLFYLERKKRDEEELEHYLDCSIQ